MSYQVIARKDGGRQKLADVRVWSAGCARTPSPTRSRSKRAARGRAFSCFAGPPPGRSARPTEPPRIPGAARLLNCDAGATAEPCGVCRRVRRNRRGAATIDVSRSTRPPHTRRSDNHPAGGPHLSLGARHSAVENRYKFCSSATRFPSSPTPSGSTPLSNPIEEPPPHVPLFNAGDERNLSRIPDDRVSRSQVVRAENIGTPPCHRRSSSGRQSGRRKEITVAPTSRYSSSRATPEASPCACADASSIK